MGEERDVLQYGDERLTRRCEPVVDVRDPAFRSEARALVATLAAFRRRNGFGRGIAAPQIGVMRRFIAIDLGEGARVYVNPTFTAKSAARFTLWDDCMSFPHLLVRVSRHRTVTMRYIDDAGHPGVWEATDSATAELLQHELDHLDGILAFDRAVGENAVVARDAFERDRGRYLATVDP